MKLEFLRGFAHPEHGAAGPGEVKHVEDSYAKKLIDAGYAKVFGSHEKPVAPKETLLKAESPEVKKETTKKD